MIDFQDIKKLFPETEWDVGYLSAEDFYHTTMYPVKYIAHPVGDIYMHDIHFNKVQNCIVLIRKGNTWDYTHYSEMTDILEQSDLTGWYPVYTNFKRAAMLAGVGVQARNTLIYSYKFGFDMHIACIRFDDEITNVPKRTKIYTLWNNCKNCYDCVDACPAKAIKGYEEPYWFDSAACENFIAYGDDPNIPSMKQFWHKYVHPEVPQERVDELTTHIDELNRTNGDPIMKWDANGFSFDGQVTRHNGKPVNIPVCRECTSQPRCSKWNGKFPYDQAIKENEERFGK